MILARSRAALPRPPGSLTMDDATTARSALSQIPRAEALLRAARYGEAEERYRRIMCELPDVRHAATAAALLGLADARAYRRIVAGVHSNIGLCQLRARQYETAAQSLQTAVATDPSNTTARWNLAMAHLHLKRFGEARDELDRVLDAGVRDAKLYLDLGRAELGVGDAVRARWAFAQAMRLGELEATMQDWGTVLEAESCLAEAYQAEGNFDRAEYHLQEVLSRAHGAVPARYRLFQILARQGRRAEAEAHKAHFERDAELMASIQSVIAESPSEVRGLRWVADSYRRLGLLHLAGVHYRQVLARDPEDRKALLAIVQLHERIRDRRSNHSDNRSRKRG